MIARALFLVGGLFLGRDKRLSNSKCMAWLLAALNAAHRAPPELVQVALLVGSHGARMLSDWLQRSTFTLAATSATTRTDTHVESHAVVRTEIVDRRRETGIDEATP